MILGGSDEDDEPHPLSYHAKTKEQGPLEIPSWGGYDSVIRQDPKHKFWTTFNRDDGTRVRFDFSDTSTLDRKRHHWNKFKEEELVCSVPELVDLRITSKCDENCPWCYQNAKDDGIHADLTYIKQVFDLLARHRVFEAAIGGGETMFHPDLLEILEYARNLGIIPNFSTKSLHWLKDDNYREQIMESIGAFGYSVRKVEDVSRFGDLMGDYRLSKNKAVVHYVMGSTPIQHFEEIVREIAERDMSILLLGYKTAGRGKYFRPYDYSGWLDIIERIREGVYFELSIDTLLAEQSQKELEEADVPRWLYSVKDGSHSFYIDCVERKAGPCSYSDDTVYFPHIQDLERILTNIDEWETIREEFLDREPIAKWEEETEGGIFGP